MHSVAVGVFGIEQIRQPGPTQPSSFVKWLVRIGR